MKTTKFIRPFKMGVFTAAALCLLSGHAAAESLVALNGNNQIGVFDSGTSVVDTSIFKSITGINVGEIFVGIDFNPVADRTPNASLRLVSSAGDNYAINVATGGVTTATSIAGGYSGVAYSNSDASTPGTAPTSTALYYVNTTTDTLAFA